MLCSFCDNEAAMILNEKAGNRLSGYGVRLCWWHIPTVSEDDLQHEIDSAGGYPEYPLWASELADAIPLP